MPRKLMDEALQTHRELKSRLVEIYEKVQSGLLSLEDVEKLNLAIQKIKNNLEDQDRRLSENGV